MVDLDSQCLPRKIDMGKSPTMDPWMMIFLEKSGDSWVPFFRGLIVFKPLCSVSILSSHGGIYIYILPRVNGIPMMAARYLMVFESRYANPQKMYCFSCVS